MLNALIGFDSLRNHHQISSVVEGHHRYDAETRIVNNHLAMVAFDTAKVLRESGVGNVDVHPNAGAWQCCTNWNQAQSAYLMV